MMSTAVVCASGPSLTPGDVAAARAAACVIVVNTTFRAAPWAHHLYACDPPWWDTYIDEVRSVFTGHLWSVSPDARKRHGVELLTSAGRKGGLCDTPGTIYHGGNGGFQAIGLAHDLGYRRILLLGFDCQTGPNGEKHHHADHPGRLDREQAFQTWAECFALLAADAREKGVEIINCSRSTALDCFPRTTIDAALTDESRCRTAA